MSGSHPTADVSVRIAWAQDADDIAAVQLRAWQERYGELLDRLLTERGLNPATHALAWRQSLGQPPEARHRALVALEHDRVRGFAVTGPVTDPDLDPSAQGEVGEFTVDPQHTRRGHGSRLLQACADTLRADRFDRVVCWVDSTDDALRAFLTSAGWAPDGASRELADESGAGTVKQVRLHTSLA